MFIFHFIGINVCCATAQWRVHRLLTETLSTHDFTAECNVASDLAKSALAGFAAATLLAAAPAEAGVKLQKAEVKNFVKGTSPAAAPKSSGAKAAAPKKNQNAGDPDGFDFKILVFPLSVIGVAAGGAALATLDPGFLEFMEEASTKDSRPYAGYETGLKDTPFFGGSGDVPKSTTGGKKTTSKKKKGLF